MGSIPGSGAIALGSGRLTTGGDNDSTTLSGVISGISGALTKIGTGTLTLSGANTYGDGAVVSAGTLNVTGSLALVTVVAIGATLTGTGRVAALTVNGTLAPGASTGVLHTGNLSFGSTGVFAVEIGGVTAGLYDQVQVISTVALNGALNVTPFGGFTPTASGSYALIANDDADPITATRATTRSPPAAGPTPCWAGRGATSSRATRGTTCCSATWATTC